MGVYCRCWATPLIDGGTVRLPRLVGEGRAMDLVLAGRKVDAEEALQIGLSEYVVPDGQGHKPAEELAKSPLQFPQSCMKADRWLVRSQHGLPAQDARRKELWNNKAALSRGGIVCAKRFASDKGCGGSFKDL